MLTRVLREGQALSASVYEVAPRAEVSAHITVVDPLLEGSQVKAGLG